MRLLVSSSPGLGHVQPMIPLAVEMQRRGHDVVWAVAADASPWVQQAGIATVVAGRSARDRRAEFDRRWPEYAALRGEALAEKMFPRLFGEVTAEALFGPLLEAARSWQPDLVLAEAGDFAAPVVARAVGVPNVTHGFGLAVPPHRVELAAELAAPLWRSVGLGVPPFGGLYDHLYIDIFPRSLQAEELAHIPRIVRRRPESATESPAALPPRVAEVLSEGRSVVYITFGTVFNVTPAFAAAVEAVAGLDDLAAVVTVGPGGDLDAFGDLPERIAVADYVPNAEVFPRVAAVVSHAGSGTFLGALAKALPQVCIPQAADQFRNAAACERAGAGVAIRAEAPASDDVGRALRQVLDEPRYRRAATTVAEEIAAMPGVAEVAEAIEALGR